jgi:membrane fusion protein (multidrug efflux system)
MIVRRSLVWLFSVAAVVGCNKAESENGGGGGGPGGFSLPVEVATARVDTVVDAISTTGQIEAVQSILLRPEVDGRIVEILFREGSIVAKGEPLFKVDDAERVAQVARAEADRDLAKQALERTRKLVDDNASSQADLELAEATYRSNEAQLQLLQVRLDRTMVRAPFRGVVGSRTVSLGDYVTTSTEMVSLQTYNPQRAAFKVPERFAQRLAAGQEVLFRVAALPGREFRGVVEFVDPVVELPARVITVKARVSNRDRVLHPGAFIEVRLATEVRPSAVIVPEEAVVPLEGLVIAWVVNAEGTAERREVTLGVRTPGFVEVRSGIDGNEQVVVGGQVRLQPGMPVTPIPVDRPPQGGGTDAAPGGQPGTEAPPGHGAESESPDSGA